MHLSTVGPYSHLNCSRTFIHQFYPLLNTGLYRHLSTCWNQCRPVVRVYYQFIIKHRIENQILVNIRVGAQTTPKAHANNVCLASGEEVHMC